MGEAPEQMVLVETAEDVERLEVPEPLQGRVSDADHAERGRCERGDRRASGRFPKIANPPKDDICYATQNRQEAVRELASRADWCWFWGARTARTAGGWPRSPSRWEFRPI